MNVSFKDTIVFVKETNTSVAELLFPAAYRRKALALLLLAPERPMYLRQIARATGGSAGTMKKELDQLERVGLLTRQRQGNQALFAANRQHPVFEELSALLRKTVGLADVVAAALAPLSDRVDVAFVFGSMARDSAHAGSDVDVAIIGNVTFEEALSALYPAQSLLQREINPKVFDRAEWIAKLGSNSAFVREISLKPKLFLIGNQDDLDQLGQSPEERTT